MTSNRPVSEMVERDRHAESCPLHWLPKGHAGAKCWCNLASSQAPSDDVVEMVARAIEKRPTDEPEMPGLSGHYPETEYHGAARYQVKCDCGFKTEPTNYYVAKAQWAAHAIAAIPSAGGVEEAARLARNGPGIVCAGGDGAGEMTAFSYRTVTCHDCNGNGFVTGTFGGGEYRCDDCCGLGWVCRECSGCGEESPLNSEGLCAECAAVVETVGDPTLRKDAA